LVLMGDRLTDYQGLITGIPKHVGRPGSKEARTRKSKAKTKS
jgi:hypothetical protein